MRECHLRPRSAHLTNILPRKRARPRHPSLSMVRHLSPRWGVMMRIRPLPDGGAGHRSCSRESPGDRRRSGRVLCAAGHGSWSSSMSRSPRSCSRRWSRTRRWADRGPHHERIARGSRGLGSRVQRHDRRDRGRHVGDADEYQLRACARAHSSSRTIGRTGVDRLSCRRATIMKPARSNIESVPL
jgi:hypothetical protein